MSRAWRRREVSNPDRRTVSDEAWMGAALMRAPEANWGWRPANRFCSTSVPYIEYKRQLCHGLPLELTGIAGGEGAGLVSVVLPVYNGDRNVAYAIESVLSQTYSNIELIVVNHASSDATASLATAYERDRRVHVLRQPARNRQSALSQGLGECTGEYWTWISAENALLPDMIASLTEFLRTRPDVQAVYADQEVMREDGSPAIDSGFCPDFQVFGSATVRWPRDPGQLGSIGNKHVAESILCRAWAARIAGGLESEAHGAEEYDLRMRLNDLFQLAHWGHDRPLSRARVSPESRTAREEQAQDNERMQKLMRFAEKRRQFFTRPFDLAFFGRHPWFHEMAAHYRMAGNNVFEARECNQESQYRYRVTRAFEKAVAFFGERVEPAAMELARASGCVVAQFAERRCAEAEIWFTPPGTRPSAGGFSVPGPGAALYPALARANLLAHKQHFSFAGDAAEQPDS